MSAASHLLLSASAGTGKTHQVVELYLSLLLGRPFPASDGAVPGMARGAVYGGAPPVPPERILMLTFGRHAAAEMKTRIVAALEKEISSGEGADPNLCWSLLRRLAGATIATIHSFAQQLLAQHALRQALAPSVRVVDGAEAEEMLRALLDEALREGLRSDDADWVAALEELCGGRTPQSVVAALEDALRASRVWGVDLARIDPEAMVSRPPAPSAADLRALERRLREFLAGASSKAAADLHVRLRAELEAAGRGELAPQAVSAAARRLATGIASNWGKSGGAVREGVVGELKRLAAWEAQARAAALLVGFLRLARECAGRYEQAKRQQGVVDFDDLLLQAAELARRQPEVIPAFDVLIVDEAQDNSFIQNELLGQIARHAGAALVVCGDRKQSIYTWRGADPDGMARLAGAFPGLAAPLQTSYRSQRGLLDWVNATFARVFEGAGLYGPEAHLQPCAAAQGTSGPNVEVLAADGDEPRSCRAAACGAPAVGAKAESPSRSGAPTGAVPAQPGVRHGASAGPTEEGDGADGPTRVAREARAIARRIRLLAGGGADWAPAFRWDGQGWASGAAAPAYAYRDVLILLRATTSQALYEAALREEGIPYSTDGRGRGFFCRQEVLDVVSLLRALAFPFDDVALVALLRSPFVCLSDGALSLLALRVGGGRKAAKRELRAALAAGPDLAERLAGELRDAGLAEDEAAYRRGVDLLRTLRRLAGRVSAVELVREAVQLTGYDAVLAGSFHGVQRLANLRKLLSWIRTRERSETLDLQAVARRLQQMLADESEPDAAVMDPLDDSVRINTVHAAKGLSSPIVIVPDLRRRTRHDTAWVRLRPPRAGRAAAFVGKLRVVREDEGAVVDAETPGFDEFRAEREQERDAESCRLFYVACTRPRDLLVLSGADAGGTGAGRWQEWVTGGGEEGGEGGGSGDVRRRTYGEVAEARAALGAGPAAEPRVLQAESLTRGGLRERRAAAETYRLSATLLVRLLQGGSAGPAADAGQRVREALPRIAGLAPAWLHGRSGQEEAGERPGRVGDGAEEEEGVQAGAAWGTLVHAVLERIEYGSGVPLARQVELAPELAPLNATQRRQAQRTLTQAAERLAQELGGAAEDDVLREVPFVARFEHDGACVLADGKLDLLFRRDGVWTLVDYKVTQSAARRLVDDYGLQLALYRDAVSEPAGAAGRRRVVFGGEPGEFRMVIAAIRRDAKIELVPLDAGAYPDVAARVVSAARSLRWMTGRGG